MPSCDNCGARVSTRLAGVFADADGEIHACPDGAADAGISAVSSRQTRNA